MERTKTVYWICTALVSLGVLASGTMYFVSPQMTEEFKHFGFPDYFRKELGFAKIIAGIVLITPAASLLNTKWGDRFKEWAYAGLGITFISAIITHSAVGDGLKSLIGPAVFFILLEVSNRHWKKMKSQGNE